MAIFFPLMCVSCLFFLPRYQWHFSPHSCVEVVYSSYLGTGETILLTHVWKLFILTTQIWKLAISSFAGEGVKSLSVISFIKIDFLEWKLYVTHHIPTIKKRNLETCVTPSHTNQMITHKQKIQKKYFWLLVVKKSN